MLRFISYNRYVVESFIFKTHKDYKLEDTIIISGTPRGGTTWFLEILETLPDYRSIFEPFHREWFSEIKRLNIPPRPYLEPNAENKPLKEYLYKVFTGRIASKQPRLLTPTEVYKLIKGRKLIVKFIRANRILPWIVTNFELRGTYLLIRHPCAIIASQLETGIRGYFTPKRVPLSKKIVFREAYQIPAIRNNEWLMKKLNTIDKQEEVLAAIWSMDNYVPLAYLSENPNAYYVVVYEKLLNNFEDEANKLFNYIHEKVPKKAYKKFTKPSKTTHDSSYIGTQKQLLKWKKKLTKHQVKNILKVTHWFGLDFYNENPEPDYNSLKNWTPQI
ncbi:hypothetical protein EP1X_01285 [Thermococcus sp. EP1]|nr:hypothetical protein EP1X_01285 [Thermococcus sp. EP1]